MVRQNSYSFKLDKAQQASLIGHLRSGNYEPRSVPYTIIAVAKPKVQIALYTSGKCVVQGKESEDWVKFVAQPFTYTIKTTATLGFPVDTFLTLYDTNHTSQLAENDDDPANPPLSKITYGFPVTGTYFIKAKHFNSNVGGCGPEYRYTLAITTTSLSSPMPERVAYLAPRPQTMYQRTGVFLPLYWKE